MKFISILGFALIATVLLMMIRKERPEIAVLLSLSAAGLILISLLGSINQILTVFETLALKSQINPGYLKLIIKIIGIAYLAGFGAQICRDANEGSIAAKVELAGKICILSMGIPVMVGLLEIILKAF